MSGPAIEVTSLTKRYGRSRGVDDLDFEVAAGEVFGFLGPNGAGKTTTIRLLLDLIRPTSGSAKILGLDCRTHSLEVRRCVGYIPGELNLYPGNTGSELIAWFARLRGGVDDDVVSGLVERFDVEMDRPVGSLSKGNRQKIGLVQAFMHRPSVLILDEASSGLDPLMQEQFHDLIRQTTDEGGTVFLSSHSLDEAQRIADRVGIIREGQLVAVESVDALRGRALRHVQIRFGGRVPVAEFERLPGVSDVTVQGSLLDMRVRESLDAVVKLAACHDVRDLLSEPADLEEIFLTYYRSEDRPDDDGGHDRGT